MPKRSVGWYLHPGLVDLLTQYAQEHERTTVSVVEQAIAEFLDVAPGQPGGDWRFVQLCPVCEKGVLYRGECAVCLPGPRWHAYASNPDEGPR